MLAAMAVGQPEGDDVQAPRNSGEEQLEAAVERVVYHDARTAYTVLRLRVPGHDVLVTAVGRTSGMDAGAELSLRGVWGDHPTHGRQFQFERIDVRTPTTLGGIQRRLMQYPGVRDVMAERIVRRFGNDALTILEQHPRRLLEVQGIGPRTLGRIVEHHRTHRGPVAELEATLAELDLPTYLAAAIFARYAEASKSMLRSRPYRLAREVRGIGFATADRIARALGIALDSEERIEAGVLHVLERAEAEGHCALPQLRLVETAVGLLQVPAELLESALDSLRRSGELVLEGEGEDPQALVFLRRFADAERNVASMLVELVRAAPREPWSLPELPSGLSAGQVAAVHAVARSGVVVLTGGPGTGKSTVVQQVIALARDNHIPVQLAAPTGRAAKRLEQATATAAATVHRLLEIQPETGGFTFHRDNPLPPGLVVIDEVSMLDLPLADALLSALTASHRLLLVGDADQLPSVGAGNVLRDILAAIEHVDCGAEVVRLTEVFRQGAGSSIVHNAHRILRGTMPQADDAGSQGEFFIVPAKDGEHAHELVLKLVTERIPRAYGLDPRVDVQILCPMHKGRAGTEALNVALQAHHTEGQPELEHRSGGMMRRFRTGDRVMQMRNDYNRNVFNGDIGVVAAVDRDHGRLVVDMDDVPVAYETKELHALQLAYAMSIHKSQGSEFPAVIVPILAEHHVMLRRNLLYTAVTRARRLCVLVGDPRAIRTAVQRADAARRYTGLAARLRARLASW